MKREESKGMALIEGSRLIMEALARAGADSYIGYPITPANLLYQYGGQRLDIMLAAPDEISTLQWMSGGLSFDREDSCYGNLFSGFCPDD